MNLLDEISEREQNISECEQNLIRVMSENWTGDRVTTAQIELCESNIRYWTFRLENSPCGITYYRIEMVLLSFQFELAQLKYGMFSIEATNARSAWRVASDLSDSFNQEEIRVVKLARMA